MRFPHPHPKPTGKTYSPSSPTRTLPLISRLCTIISERSSLAYLSLKQTSLLQVFSRLLLMQNLYFLVLEFLSLFTKLTFHLDCSYPIAALQTTEEQSVYWKYGGDSIPLYYVGLAYLCASQVQTITIICNFPHKFLNFMNPKIRGFDLFIILYFVHPHINYCLI
jgi:hypothetical protein